MRFLRSSRVVLAALIAVVGASGCVQIGASGPFSYMDREEKHFTNEGRPTVVLSTFDGSIEVRPWDRPEVLVVVEKYAMTRSMTEEIEVVSDQKGSEITVDARLKKSDRMRTFWMGGPRARLVVSLPAASDLRATSGDGSINVANINGNLALRSGDGSIRGSDLAGDIKAQTGDGSIRLESVKGLLDIGTGDGSIIASGTLTSVRASSGDGSVRIRAENGSVAQDDWEISTRDGSVIVDLPRQFDADLDANTSDGRVSVSQSVLPDRDSQSRRSVRGRIGAGGHAVRVRSGDGSITVR
jgi:DUF4097 and DUF4098 domain-containing protein YvlB